MSSGNNSEEVVRKATNRYWLLVFGSSVFLLLPLLIYTLSFSDGAKLGYETNNECTYICGDENIEIHNIGIACIGKGDSKKPPPPVLEFMADGRVKCVKGCPEEYLQCSQDPGIIPQIASRFGILPGGDGYETLSSYLNRNWWHFIFSILLTISLSASLTLFYRFATPCLVQLVWCIILAIIIVCSCIVFSVWYLNFQIGVIAVILVIVITSVILVIVLTIITILLYAVRKSADLIVLLYHEAMEIIFRMPGLVIISIVAVFFQVGIVVSLIVTTLYMTTSGSLTLAYDGYYRFNLNSITVPTMILNAIVAIWATQFIAGCQYMIIAGSVSKWFFTREKEKNLESPIMRSTINTIKYHMGSASVGSLMIILVSILRTPAQLFLRSNLCDCCFQCFEIFVKYITKNVYIEVAIYGEAFFKSKKRVIKLLLANKRLVVGLNFIGDFVLYATGIVAAGLASGIGYALMTEGNWFWQCFVSLTLFNCLIAWSWLELIETIVDSLFICFCEDKLLNDGISKPYFMTKTLMLFMEKASDTNN